MLINNAVAFSPQYFRLCFGQLTEEERDKIPWPNPYIEKTTRDKVQYLMKVGKTVGGILHELRKNSRITYSTVRKHYRKIKKDYINNN